jgi:hypothetical protein
MSSDNVLKTSIYGSSNKSYPLFLGGTYPRAIDPNFKYDGPKQVTRKYLNITKNIGQKEFMTLKLTASHTYQLDPSQNALPDSDQNIFQRIQAPPEKPTVQRFINNYFPIPKFCIYNCQNCMAAVQFKNEIEIKNIKQQEINEELHRHGHKKSLKLNKGKFRNTEEGRKELIEHYKKYHPAANLEQNNGQPNTSKNLQ